MIDMNPEQLQYVEGQLAQGVSHDDIKQTLIENGYTDSQVDDLFRAASGGESIDLNDSIPVKEDVRGTVQIIVGWLFNLVLFFNILLFVAPFALALLFGDEYALLLWGWYLFIISVPVFIILLILKLILRDKTVDDLAIQSGIQGSPFTSALNNFKTNFAYVTIIGLISAIPFTAAMLALGYLSDRSLVDGADIANPTSVSFNMPEAALAPIVGFMILIAFASAVLASARRLIIVGMDLPALTVTNVLSCAAISMVVIIGFFFGAAFFILPGLIFLFFTCFAVISCMLENKSIPSSFASSFNFARSHIGVAGLSVVVIIGTCLILMPLSMAVQLSSAIAFTSFSVAPGELVRIAIAFLTQWYVWVFATSYIGILYLKNRSS